MTTRSSASPPPQPPAGYRDLRHHVAWAALPDRGRVMVRGRDALAFVDHFTTAAVTRLAEGGGCEGFFPDARGHVIALATILRTADGVVIDVGAGRGPSLAAHLEHHHIREAVEIVDESAGHAVVCVSGPDAAGWLVSRAGAVPTAPLGHVATSLGPVPALIVRCDPCGPEGYIVQVAAAHAARLVAWFAEQGLPSAADAAFEAARIEEGTPLPADLPEKTLPQEVDRDERAICFTKGCYLGQETVARIDADRRSAAPSILLARSKRSTPRTAASSAAGAAIRVSSAMATSSVASRASSIATGSETRLPGPRWPASVKSESNTACTFHAPSSSARLATAVDSAEAVVSGSTSIATSLPSDASLTAIEAIGCGAVRNGPPAGAMPSQRLVSGRKKRIRRPFRSCGVAPSEAGAPSLTRYRSFFAGGGGASLCPNAGAKASRADSAMQAVPGTLGVQPRRRWGVSVVGRRTVMPVRFGFLC